MDTQPMAKARRRFRDLRRLRRDARVVKRDDIHAAQRVGNLAPRLGRCGRKHRPHVAHSGPRAPQHHRVQPGGARADAPQRPVRLVRGGRVHKRRVRLRLRTIFFFFATLDNSR
jgi:hypothetical protein